MATFVAPETIETALKSAKVEYSSSDVEKLTAVINNPQFISSLTGVIIDEIDKKRSLKLASFGKNAKSILDL